MYRLNTYPLIHVNFLHAILNIFALVPLLERFEADHGTLLTGAMFVGRKSPRIHSNIEGLRSYLLQALSTLPAAGYLLIERVILRLNHAIMGAR